MRRTALVLVLTVGLLLAMTVAATAGGDMRDRGSCSSGSGRWELRVDRSDGRLRVRFRIDHVPAGQRWQVFMSDNGVRFFTGTRVARGGDIRITRRIRNRRGPDRVAASAVNTVNGVTCSGSVRF